MISAADRRVVRRSASVRFSRSLATDRATLLDELSVQVVKFPGFQVFTNPFAGVCDLTLSQLTPPSILDCTAQTFVPGGNAGYFWADDLHLSATAQNLFGAAAIERAQNNPF